MQAALFEDGASFGDAASVASLWHRRDALVGRFAEVTALLDQQDQAMLADRASLIDLLKARKDDALRGQKSIEERAAINASYGAFISMLTGIATEAPPKLIQRTRIASEGRMHLIQNQRRNKP